MYRVFSTVLSVLCMSFSDSCDAAIRVNAGLPRRYALLRSVGMTMQRSSFMAVTMVLAAEVSENNSTSPNSPLDM